MAAGALAEEVATNLEEVAVVTRAINTQVVSAFMGGTGFGALLGGVFGYRWGKQRTKAEAMKEAQEEIDRMRAHLAQQKAALRNEETKKIVEADLLDYESVARQYETRPLPPPVPVRPAPPIVEGDLSAPVQKTFAKEGLTQTFPWSYNDEFAKRRAGLPYVIHEDEFLNDNLPLYSNVAYSYHSVDAVLSDEDDHPIQNVEDIVGKEALNRFGHGSSDPNVVFVRNDKLQQQMEITRLPTSSFERDLRGLDDVSDSS